MNPIRSLFVALSRMPPAVMLLLIVGLAVVITMVITGNLSEIQRRAQEQEAALRARYESKSNVVCAIKDIPQGESITADAVQEKQEMVSRIPTGALPNASLAIGRTAKFSISAGQILSDRDLVGAAVATGLESTLKPGFRAVTISVNSDTGVANFITPGSHVDLYATAGSEFTTKAAAILSDCNVVAVDQDYGQQQQSASSENQDKGNKPQVMTGPGTQPRTRASFSADTETIRHITLQLESADVAKLLKGVQATSGSRGSGGKLYLTLRGFDDHMPIPIIDVDKLFAKPVLASAPSPPRFEPPPMPRGSIGPPMQQVEVWSGDHKDQISVPQT